MPEKRKDSRGRLLRNGEEQMPDGRYRYRYTDAAGKRQTIYSWMLVPTDSPPPGKRKSPKGCLREQEKQIDRDMYDGIDSVSAQKVTLNQLFETVLDMNAATLKESTRQNYLTQYEAHVADAIGYLPVANIRYSTIKHLYNGMIQQGFSIGTVSVVDTMLHPVFRVAVRDGYLRDNPLTGVLGELKKAHGYEATHRDALTIEQQQLFIEFLKSSAIYNRWLPIFTVALGTGMRVGELTALTWKDCDFKRGIIRVNHSLSYVPDENGKRQFHISTTKTRAGVRSIPMLDEVRDALKQERLKQLENGQSALCIDGYSGFCFLNDRGNVHNRNNVDNTLNNIRAAANEWERERAEQENRDPVELPHFSIHTLRHTFCTRLCERENNIKVIQSIMGHTNINTTMSIYADATDARTQESFNDLQGKILIC